jgi:hypothetical protein
VRDLIHRYNENDVPYLPSDPTPFYDGAEGKIVIRQCGT